MSRQSKQAARRAKRNEEGGVRDRHVQRIKDKQAEHSGMSVRLSRRAKRIMKMRIHQAVERAQQHADGAR